MLTKAKVLRGAIEQLDERGWTQGVELDEKGRCCARGAMKLAITGGEVRGLVGTVEINTFWEADLALMRSIGDGRTPVPDWNDQDGRSVDEVKAALRTAAERVEAQA